MRYKEKIQYLILGILICMIVIVCLIKKLTNINQPETLMKAKKEEQNLNPMAEETNQNIRVLIKTDGFQNLTHPQVILQGNQGMIVAANGEEKLYESDESITIKPDDTAFATGSIQIRPKEQDGKITLLTLQRERGTPSYRGYIELISTAEGLAVINELPMEEYLYGVVPSEMPSYFESEALKVQAVCARSYAYNQSRSYAYPEFNAHVDDSTSFQVYGNLEEQESSIEAVNATAGKKIWYKDQVISAYYYSTSSGNTTTMEAWGSEQNEKNNYLQSVPVSGELGDYEKQLPLYRWSAIIPNQVLSDLISTNTNTNIGKIKNLEITERGPGDVAMKMEVTGEHNSVTIETENKIRAAFAGAGYDIVLQDGTTMSGGNLLPSAFITVSKKDDAWEINGGGYGHGIGMSQNGANEMAKQGKQYEEILHLFYHDVSVR